MLLASCAPIRPDAPAAGQASPEAGAATLVERARARGRLPVIVRLRVPFRPEGELAPAAIDAQRAAIARARARFLEDLGVRAGEDGRLAGPGLANVKPFEAIPYLALTAEPEALARLLRHPLAASVEEDVAAPPP